jgi:hypothetical protein
LLAGVSGDGDAHFFGITMAGQATIRGRRHLGEIANARSVATRRERISKLLARVEKRLDLDKTKVTLADFIRLTQLERELEGEEQPKEIIVTWKDPEEARYGLK